MLHVQEEWGVLRSSLCGAERFMGFDFPSLWCRVGHAEKDDIVVG